jgi:hypothetical protein
MRVDLSPFAQLLVGGCAVAFSACVLIELAQAQQGYVPGVVEFFNRPWWWEAARPGSKAAFTAGKTISKENNR